MDSYRAFRLDWGPRPSRDARGDFGDHSRPPMTSVRSRTSLDHSRIHAATRPRGIHMSLGNTRLCLH